MVFPCEAGRARESQDETSTLNTRHLPMYTSHVLLIFDPRHSSEHVSCYIVFIVAGYL